MKKKYYALIIFIPFSCNFYSPIENNQSFFENFQIKQITIVDKGAFPNSFISSLQYRPDINDTIISFYDTESNLIQIKGIGKSKIEDSVNLSDLLNKNKIENILGFTYVNQDSIFILGNKLEACQQKFNYFVFLLSANGELLNSWDIAKITGIENNYFVVRSVYQNPMTFRNGLLHIMADIISHPKAKVITSEIPSELILNIEKNEGYFIFAKPEVYGEGKYYGNHAQLHSKAFFCDTTIIFSFAVDHYLYKYGISGKLLEKKECKSKFIDNFVDYEWSESMGFEKIINIQITSPYYDQLYFDKSSKLLYRLVLHKQNSIKQNGEKASIFDRSFSLIVLNEDLQIIGEYFVPPYHLYPWLIDSNMPGGPFFALNSHSSKYIIAEYQFIDPRME